jgi:hypothetical protein
MRYLLLLSLSGLSGCFLFDGTHGDETCVEACDPSSSYCSVGGDQDPDGGCQFSAVCRAFPASCEAAPTCECLADVERQPYRDQGWNDDEITVNCDLLPGGGFRIESSVSGCLPSE